RGIVNLQAVCCHGLEVVAAGDRRDVMAVLVQPGADHAADRAGTVNDETHEPPRIVTGIETDVGHSRLPPLGSGHKKRSAAGQSAGSWPRHVKAARRS